MKTKIFVYALVLLLALGTLVACGFGGYDYDDGAFTVYCYADKEGEAEELEVKDASGNVVDPAHRRHYIFLGYYTAEGVQVFDETGAQTEGFLIDKDITVYAKFEAIEYTVRFDAGEGTLPADFADTVKINADAWELSLVPIPTPTDPSLEFVGWGSENYGGLFTDEYGTVDYQFFSPDNRYLGIDDYKNEIVFCARYQKKQCEVILDYNNGTLKTEVLSVEYGSSLSFDAYMADDTVGCYQVIGWSTSPYELLAFEGPVTDYVRLYAIWQKYKNVNFVYGTGDIRTVKILDADGTYVTLPDASRLGHDFDGWYETANLSGNPKENIPFDSLADTYYAKFVPIDYTLTFVTGIDESVAPLIYHYGYTGKLPVLTRTGYTHLGWSDKDDGTGRTFFYLPTGTMESMTLYAVWQANTYQLSLSLLDGRAPMQGNVTYGEQDRLPVPARVGFDFLGWFDGTDENAVQVTDADGNCFAPWMIDGGATLYAKWGVITYTLTFNTRCDFTVESMTYQYGNNTALPTLTRAGYSFGGWALSSTATGTGMTRIPDTLYGDKTLYAVWNGNPYTVVLDPGEGKVTTTSKTVYYGQSYTLPKPTREGYNFLGWFDGKGESATQMTNEEGASLVLWSTLDGATLYAKWEIKTYTVTYYESGTRYTSQTYLHGEPLVLPQAPTKSDKLFAGWYTMNNSAVTGGGAVTSDFALEAKWLVSTGISTKAELEALRTDPSGTYHLTADINLGGAVFTPIELLTGTLDGQGHKIYNFILGTSNNYTAFIVLNSGTIRNIVFDGVTGAYEKNGVSGQKTYNYLAVIAGENTAEGTIDGCTVTGAALTFKNSLGEKHTSYAYVGSVVATNAGVITNCKSSATLNGSYYGSVGSGWNDANYYGYIGGIAGHSAGGGSIRDCAFEGSIDAICSSKSANHAYSRSQFYCGGVIGYNEAECLNCYADTAIAVNGDWTAETDSDGNYDRGYQELFVGGFVGWNATYSAIARSYSAGAVTLEGRLMRLGGFAGWNGGTISDCYSTVTVTGTGGKDCAVGGFIGKNEKSISNCYATGNVASKTGSCGGFAGVNSAAGMIINSFSTGNVSGEAATGKAHALCGENAGTLNRSYYSNTAAVTLGGAPIESAAMGGVTAQDPLSFTSAAFIYDTLYWEATCWVLGEGAYPQLIWQ